MGEPTENAEICWDDGRGHRLVMEVSFGGGRQGARASTVDDLTRALCELSTERYGEFVAALQRLHVEEGLVPDHVSIGLSADTCRFRGSVTDLATDVAALLTAEQGQELAFELSKFVHVNTGKYRADVQPPGDPGQKPPLYAGGEEDDGWDQMELKDATRHAGLIECGSRRYLNDVRKLRSVIVRQFQELQKLGLCK